MATVLVATLGTSPLVVTAMAQALAHHPDGPRVALDRVHVIYPHRSGMSNALIDLGADLIEEALAGQGIAVTRTWIDSDDVDSRPAAVAFLRALDTTLTTYKNDQVYVSCAGGRKVMSALAAVVTQFHRQVQGVYHILDRFEHDLQGSSLFTIEQLYQMDSQVRQARMYPPAESLHLVSIPHRSLTRPDDLRAALGRLDREDSPNEIAMDDVARSFFAELFGGLPEAAKLEISFTQRAAEQFREFDRRGSTHADPFWTCFEQMRDPVLLKDRCHGFFKSGQQRDVVYHFYKRHRTPERPFFYTEPYDVSLFPGKPVQRVIVAGLTVEREGTYDFPDHYWMQHEPFAPEMRLGDLRTIPTVLLIPLGETPMVATQFSTLLQQHEQQEIKAIWLLYPDDNQQIRRDAQLLERLFTTADLTDVRGYPPVQVKCLGIPDLVDVDSAEACARYALALGSAIADCRQAHQDAPLRLLISGGRKAMAALTYYAAQQAGLPEVWHTVVCDLALEERVRRETDRATRGQIDRRALAERLFLGAYQDQADAFALFTVPVLPLQP